MQYLLGGGCLRLVLLLTRDEGFSVFAISDASVSSLADACKLRPPCSLIECSPTWDWTWLVFVKWFLIDQKQLCFNKIKQAFLKCIIPPPPPTALSLSQLSGFMPNGPEILRHAWTNFWSRSYLVVKYNTILYCCNTYCDVLIFFKTFIEPNSVVCWTNIWTNIWEQFHQLMHAKH